MYAKITNNQVAQYPYSIQMLKQDNPNTSFPNNIDYDYTSLAGFDVVRVFPTPEPTFNPLAERVTESVPVYNTQESRWEQAWTVSQLSQGQIQANAEALMHQITDRVQQRLDEFARTRNYDGILSAATYATSAVPKFAAEGQYAVTVRDQTWAVLYQILADVQAGTRPMPTSYEDIEGELPELVWPEPV